MIIRKDDLESAVEHGIISAKDARNLSEFTLKRSTAPRAINEHFRLFSNFSEVFICLGLSILFSALNTLISPSATSPVYTLLTAGGFWVFAEFFTQKTTKMAPALFSVIFSGVLALNAFEYSTGIAAAKIFNMNRPDGFLIAAFIAIFALLAFLRFRIPALLVIIVAATAGAGVLLTRDTFGNLTFLWSLGITGAATLATAIWFDSRDPLRRSRQNAYAFWLFIIGSPLAIHPLFASVWLQAVDNDKSLPVFLIVFVLATLVTIAGLLLDRRSLVASSLIYFTVTIGYFNYNLTGSNSLAVVYTPLLIGTFVIVIGILWYKIRARLLNIIPLGKFKAFLPPSN
ncbi:MAG TPA: hypothetical protein ENJ55_02950 [Rhizobiales bacterium]|nr:hypothetical protein [Hyphomicrobiales bacterium]